VREARRGDGLAKVWSAKVFYGLLAQMSDTRLPRDSGDFRLLDKAVVAIMREIREESRYMRGLVSWVGFEQAPLPYVRDPRYAGETKYPLRKMLRFAADAITSFSDRPLRLSMQFGLFVTIVALLMAAWIVIGKLLYPETIVQGWTSMIVAVLFLGGAQLLSIGILGEYVARIYRETKGRPLYVVARRYGFGRDE
jgi:dolichol-phosphate mannosyltransferase